MRLPVNNTDVVLSIPASPKLSAFGRRCTSAPRENLVWGRVAGLRRSAGRCSAGPMEQLGTGVDWSGGPSAEPGTASATPGDDRPATRAQLVVVRHGQTSWSRDGRHTGRTDVPLLDAGEAQARALRGRLAGLQVTTVLVSPLARARRTCELAGFAANAEIDPDLAEWDYGAYEGRTTAEIRVQRPGWSLWSDGVERGETLAALSDRADRVVAKVRRQSGVVLAFGHGHALRVLGARWIGLDPSAASLFVLSPCGLGVLGWEHETPAMRSWNIDGSGTIL